MPRNFFLFGFIHEGRSFDLFQCAFGGFFQDAFGGVGGLLGGVGEPLSFPTCFGKDMSINSDYLLPSGSEQNQVFHVGSIPIQYFVIGK